MKESAKNLSKLIDECTYFMNIESKAREAVSVFFFKRKKKV